MGVYIKGMEMPKNCLECVFYRKTSPTYDYCCISTAIPKGYIPKDCPLVEEKTGKWIDGWRSGLDGTRYWYRACSECGYERDDDDAEKDTNYCPNCGARMAEE